MHFDLHRMPELLCGFPRARGEPPVVPPIAGAPQAWSAASVLTLLQVCLGLEISGPDAEVRFTRPQLPAAWKELRIRNLEVAGARVDLVLRGQEQGVSVRELRRAGVVRIVVR